jgi:uncharacterized membrane protein
MATDTLDMKSLSQSPFFWALLSAFAYGVCGPFHKAIMNSGTSIFGATIVYGLGIAAAGAMTTTWTGLFPNRTIILYTIAMGIIGGFGMRFASRAFSFADGNVSTVLFTVGIFPMIGTILGFLIWKEQAGLHLPKFLIGAAFILLGLYFVNTSQRVP